MTTADSAFAEDRLRAYVDGLDKLDEQLGGIRQSFRKLTSYTDLKDIAARGLKDIDVLKTQAGEMKDAFEYASMSEQSNNAGIVDSRHEMLNKVQETHRPTLTTPVFKHNPSFSHPQISSEDDLRGLLDSLMPTYTGLKVRYLDKNSLGLLIRNEFNALLTLDRDKGWKVMRINLQSIREGGDKNDKTPGTRKQDYLVSEYTLMQQISAYCTTLIDEMDGSLPLTLALLDSYTHTLFKQSCYLCHRLISATQLIPPHRNVHTDYGWITLHTNCMKQA